MKTTATRSILAALCLGLCSCAEHSAYYKLISRNLDIARAQGRISERDYFQSRMQLEAIEDRRKAERNARIRLALGGIANNASAQIRENQARQADFNNRMILQRMQSVTAQPRTYDSTVTPTYPPVARPTFTPSRPVATESRQGLMRMRHRP